MLLAVANRDKLTHIRRCSARGSLCPQNTSVVYEVYSKVSETTRVYLIIQRATLSFSLHAELHRQQLVSSCFLVQAHINLQCAQKRFHSAVAYLGILQDLCFSWISLFVTFYFCSRKAFVLFLWAQGIVLCSVIITFACDGTGTVRTSFFCVFRRKQGIIRDQTLFHPAATSKLSSSHAQPSKSHPLTALARVRGRCDVLLHRQ